MGFKLKKLNYLFKYKSTNLLGKIKEINNNLPIKLKHNQDLIDRIHSQYPYLEKHEISTIVITTFSIIREILVSGDIINIYNLFFDVKFNFFKARKNADIAWRLRGNIKTAPNLRK